eukprot:7302020-Prymnesium_polylepis.1
MVGGTQHDVLCAPERAGVLRALLRSRQGSTCAGSAERRLPLGTTLAHAPWPSDTGDRSRSLVGWRLW